MISPVIQFIKDSYIQSKSDLLLESFEIFLQAQLPDYENDFIELLMQQDNLDRSELPIQIEGMVVDILTAMINENGVILDPDTPLYMLNIICSGLNNIEYYLDTEEILRIIEISNPAEDTLSEIIGSVTTSDSEKIVVYLHEVNDSLISKINELFESRASDSQSNVEENSLISQIVLKIKNIDRFLGNEDYVGIQLLKAGVIAGNLFDEYVRYFHHHLEDKTTEQVAKELFIMLTLSKDGYSSLIETYSIHADFLFHDIDKVTKVKTQLVKLQIEFDKYMYQRNTATALQDPGKIV